MTTYIKHTIIEQKKDFMEIANSILHVTASENVDISNDLLATQSKSLGQLVAENEKKEIENQSEKG